MNRVLVLAFVATIVAIALWDILRRNPHLLSGMRPPPPEPRRKATPNRPARTPAGEIRGQVIELRRDPYQILGIDRDATPAELEARIAQHRRENDPQKLDGMSEELRAHAERRLAEVEGAYRQLTEGS